MWRRLKMSHNLWILAYDLPPTWLYTSGIILRLHFGTLIFPTRCHREVFMSMNVAIHLKQENLPALPRASDGMDSEGACSCHFTEPYSPSLQSKICPYTHRWVEFLTLIKEICSLQQMAIIIENHNQSKMQPQCTHLQDNSLSSPGGEKCKS